MEGERGVLGPLGPPGQSGQPGPPGADGRRGFPGEQHGETTEIKPYMLQESCECKTQLPYSQVCLYVSVAENVWGIHEAKI